ncbi:SERTA domain-containing protein 2 [Tachysurus vachellii]|nr:SERTA domain-containing protein 2 [Tachysurus vachellii]
MSCTGLKRTLEPEDEDEPDTQPKMAAVWAESSTAYSWQRQTVLQLSLQKLCHVPCLGRRVLITNMLRLIQGEISHQGAPRPSPPADDCQKLPQHQALEVSLTPAWVLEQDVEPDFSPKDGFISTLAELDETHASSSSSTLSESETNRTEKETPMQTIFLESHLDFTQPTLSHTPSLVNPSLPSSCPAFLPELSLDDFLFSDLDNFLCELNPCTLNLSSSSGSQSKVVSMVTDDLVRSLTNQPFKTDLNDLEHIMEVLVGS